jgi:hypothetical protein
MNIIQMGKNMEKVSLSGDDVNRIAEGKATILSYTDLEKYDNLDMVFGNKDCLILLYEIRKGNGHWTTLIRDSKNNTILFFDPYSIKMDGELAYTHYYHESGVPHLTRLVNDSGYRLIENQFQYQEFKKDVNTCGRWSSFRCRMSNLSPKEFQKLFSDMSAPQRDYYVSVITMFM